MTEGSVETWRHIRECHRGPGNCSRTAENVPARCAWHILCDSWAVGKVEARASVLRGLSYSLFPGALHVQAALGDLRFTQGKEVTLESIVLSGRRLEGKGGGASRGSSPDPKDHCHISHCLQIFPSLQPNIAENPALHEYLQLCSWGLSKLLASPLLILRFSNVILQPSATTAPLVQPAPVLVNEQ